MHDATQLKNLLIATAQQDRAAFDALYKATSGHLYALLLRMLRQEALAEEALQDCYLRVWQKAELFDPDRGAAMTWLTGVARNRALDLMRRNRPEVTDDGVTERTESPLPEPDTGAADANALSRLNACLEAMSESQRSSLLMAYYAGYTHEEMAQHFDKPLGTVKSWVRRGLISLRACLGVGE